MGNSSKRTKYLAAIDAVRDLARLVALNDSVTIGSAEFVSTYGRVRLHSIRAGSRIDDAGVIHCQWQQFYLGAPVHHWVDIDPDDAKACLQGTMRWDGATWSRY
jgi:hypothetical protein